MVKQLTIAAIQAIENEVYTDFFARAARAVEPRHQLEPLSLQDASPDDLDE